MPTSGPTRFSCQEGRTVEGTDPAARQGRGPGVRDQRRQASAPSDRYACGSSARIAQRPAGWPERGGAVVHADGQVPPGGPDRHVPIVAEGVNRPPQDVGVGRSGLGPTRLLVRHPEGSLSRGLRRGPVGASLQRIAGESPPEGMGPVAVPRCDERHHRRPELHGGAEAARAHALPLQDAEEQLELVHPRGVLRRVVEHEAMVVAGIEGGPALLGPVKVDVEAIPDDMHQAPTTCPRCTSNAQRSD
jgi:hypothetical protein